MTRTCCTYLAILVATAPLHAEPPRKPERLTVRVVGLFAPAREKALREALKKHPELTLVDLNYADGELTVEFVRDKVFPGAPKIERVIELLNDKIRSATYHTIGATPRTTTPRANLSLVTIPVIGCDCAGCNLAAAEAVERLEGVARVTVCFKEGKLTARIDPAKIKREALEAALKNAGVTLKSSPTQP